MLMEDISINYIGNILFYYDKKGYEDFWCKYYILFIICDIWLCFLNGNCIFCK